MENAVKSRLQSVQVGPEQVYKNIAILPLLVPADGALTITEVSADGPVPELTVANQ